MRTCDYRHGDNHTVNSICGWWCHSIAEDALESALHQHLTEKK